MRMQKETVGLATGTKGQLRGRNSSGGSVVDPPENTPTLAEAGIDKHLADSARRAEKLSQDEFEQVITNIMKKGGKRKKRSISQKHNGKKGKNQVDTSEYIKRLNDGSQAMHLVETAILHLKRIEDKDPKRIEALKYINKWIKTQLKGGTK